MNYRPEDWKPGDVALVANSHGRLQRAVLVRERRDVVGDMTERRWEYANATGTFDNERYVSEARRLVVIDPEDTEQVEGLARAWESQKYAHLNNQPMTLNAYRMQAALREFANPTTPKPEEPTGLGAVVRDRQGAPWVRWSRGDGAVWRCPDVEGFAARAWTVLDAVEVLSEGVRP